jgi:selenocysteine lyase/cysteine desulfurase
VVLLGPHEHHSNILPWRESSAKVVHLPQGADGGVDRGALREALRAYASHALIIGSFSAASNVTGVVADVDGITEELHRAGALAFWDYAAAASYLDVDMNPVRFLADGALNPFVYKDAVFISPHKLPGGPGSPGVLVAKRALFVNDVPAEPGGGTVFFVTGSDQRYISNRHEREEGGTQDIVGSIRAGLAFQVKHAVGGAVIAAAEASLTRRIYQSLLADANIAVLSPPSPHSIAAAHAVPNGSSAPARLPVISFLVRGPADAKGRSRFLHNSFVCAVLNDVFGVQVRGGCACAGPYALHLLGIDTAASAALETLLLDQAEVMRPGFVRLSLPYFASDAEVEYALAAVHAVADHGWRMLPLYRLDAKTGEWRHKARARSFPERKWLAHMRFPVAAAVYGVSGVSGAVAVNADVAGDTGGARDQARAPPPPEHVLQAMLGAQLAAGLELLELCGQQQAGGSQQQQLRMPALSALEVSGEHEMLTSGVRDEEDDDRGRLSYDSPGGGGEAPETSTTGSRRSATTTAVDPALADSLRWFMFPSEGAALLRAELRHVTSRAAPRAGPHLPLSVRPPPGRLAGVIRPIGYDDTRGVSDLAAPAWPTGMERLRLVAAASDHAQGAGVQLIEAGTEDVPRTVSHKHPLRGLASAGGIKGGLAHHRAISAAGGNDAVAKLARAAGVAAMDGSHETHAAVESMAALTARAPMQQLKQLPLSHPAEDAAAATEEEVVDGLRRTHTAVGSMMDAPPPARQLSTPPHPFEALEVPASITVDMTVSSMAAATAAEEDEDEDETADSKNDLTGPISVSKFSKFSKFAVPPPKLLGLVAKAVSEWSMIQPGDRVMLGLSGGKDSLAMLHLLRALQRRYPPGTFELACCTIDPGTEAFNPRPLIAYVESLGIPYFYQEERIMDMANGHMSGDSICAFCARMKRGALYSCMRQNGYNKLVLSAALIPRTLNPKS